MPPFPPYLMLYMSLTKNSNVARVQLAKVVGENISNIAIGYCFLPFLTFLWTSDTNRNNPICVALLKVAKARKEGDIAWR